MSRKNTADNERVAIPLMRRGLNRLSSTCRCNTAGNRFSGASAIRLPLSPPAFGLSAASAQAHPCCRRSLVVCDPAARCCLSSEPSRVRHHAAHSSLPV